MEDNIDKLKKAIAEKEAPMALAQTRLDIRSERPNVELCRDAVQYRLIEEVTEISGSVQDLQARLAQSEASLKVCVHSFKFEFVFQRPRHGHSGPFPLSDCDCDRDCDVAKIGYIGVYVTIPIDVCNCNCNCDVANKWVPYPFLQLQL